MKYIIILAIVFVSFGCKNDLKNSIIRIEGVERKYSAKGVWINVHLIINRNMDSLIKKEGASSCYIYCPLIKTNFATSDIGKQKYFIEGGGLEKFKNPDSVIDGNYHYTLPLQILAKGYKETIEKSEISTLLEDKACTDCKIFIVYMAPIVSKKSPTFCIPSDSILNEIK